MQKKLLIVDDEKSILKSLERLFRRSPYSVITTDSAAEALRLIESEPLAVLLSDYSMPGMTGATLLANAKELRPEMTRIILSGNSDQAAVINSINEGGAHRYLTKPWDDKTLLNEIGEAFEKYHATQYVDEQNGLLTIQAFSEKVQNFLNTPNEKQAVFAFAPEWSNQPEIDDFQYLHQCISQCVLALPWLSEESFALGLLEQNRFCLIITTSDIAYDIAVKLQHDLPNRLRSAKLEVPMKLRIGFTQSNQDKNTEQILQECTIALKEAMELGHGRPLQYAPSQCTALKRKASIESRLFAAVDRKELYINYQPKICSSTHTLRGAEALLRWKNPDLGLISPVEFIPAAEMNGLINPIGLWVMEESLKQWKAWFGDHEEHVRISINVSTVQLDDPLLLTSVEQLIQQTRIHPKSMELELTETSLMRDASSARKLLDDFKALGLHLSIDDFGTGYSSLSYLSQLPIDTIKIDRSFILPMLSHKRSESLVKNIIAMAKDLNKETVAEGVETAEQLDKLFSLGCDVIQGYFFSKPLSADNFKEHYVKPFSQHHDRCMPLQFARYKSS